MNRRADEDFNAGRCDPLERIFGEEHRHTDLREDSQITQIAVAGIGDAGSGLTAVRTQFAHKTHQTPERLW